MSKFEVTGQHHQFGGWSKTVDTEDEAKKYAKSMEYTSFGIKITPLHDTQYKDGDVVLTKEGREVLILKVYPLSLYGKFLDDGHHSSWNLSGKYVTDNTDHAFDIVKWVRNS